MDTATAPSPSAVAAPTWDAATLAEAMALADAGGTVREAAAALRQRYGLRVVVVDAMDMRGETAAITGSRRALYFGSSDGHCWQVTQDPAQVSGLFLVDR